MFDLLEQSGVLRIESASLVSAVWLDIPDCINSELEASGEQHSRVGGGRKCDDLRVQTHIHRRGLTVFRFHIQSERNRLSQFLVEDFSRWRSEWLGTHREIMQAGNPGETHHRDTKVILHRPRGGKRCHSLCNGRTPVVELGEVAVDRVNCTGGTRGESLKGFSGG